VLKGAEEGRKEKEKRMGREGYRKSVPSDFGSDLERAEPA